MHLCLCVRVLWVKADSQSPQHDPAHSGRWPEGRNSTIRWNWATDCWRWKCDQANVCELSVYVSGDEEGDAGVQLFPPTTCWLFLFSSTVALAAFNEVWPVSSQWGIKAGGRKKQTSATLVLRRRRHFVSMLTSFTAAAYWNAQDIPSSHHALDVCDSRWIE